MDVPRATLLLENCVSLGDALVSQLGPAEPKTIVERQLQSLRLAIFGLAQDFEAHGSQESSRVFDDVFCDYSKIVTRW